MSRHKARETALKAGYVKCKPGVDEKEALAAYFRLPIELRNKLAVKMEPRYYNDKTQRVRAAQVVAVVQMHGHLVCGGRFCVFRVRR